MITEIISVGTELLLGQITDTNRPYFAQHLSELGMSTFHQSIVGDNYTRMFDEITLAASRADLIVLIGGLGPTEDDLTKNVVADFLQQPLDEDSAALKKIIDWHAKTNIPMVDSNRRQAQYIHNGQAVKNEVGFAVGSFYANPNGSDFLLLPGPPWEFEPMVDHTVIPLLKQHYLADKVIESLVLRFYGIGESRLENELRPLIDTQTNPTIATYAKQHEVTVRLTAQASTQAQAQQLNQQLAEKITHLVGEFLYGFGDDTDLATVTANLINDQQKPIVLVDQYTNGQLLQQLINANPVVEPLIYDNTAEYTKASSNMRALIKQYPEALILEVTPESSNVNSNNPADYVTEDVSFSVGYAQQMQNFTRTFARSHTSNINSAEYVGLDVIRRTLLDLPLLARK